MSDDIPTTLVEDVIGHLPIEHLIGVSLLVVTLVAMVLYFSWKVIREHYKKGVK